MSAAALALTAAWLAFFFTFYLSHLQVRSGGKDARPERRVRRERSSDGGMALQFLGVLIVLFWPGPWRERMLIPGLATALASIVWVRSALKHLGRQWRVQAVVTDDHELITTGPFQLVRHPVYLAFAGMLLATIVMRGWPMAGVAAMAAFVAGTEIRVQAEERLLAATFGERFASYRARTRWAYLPGLR